MSSEKQAPTAGSNTNAFSVMGLYNLLMTDPVYLFNSLRFYRFITYFSVL